MKYTERKVRVIDLPLKSSVKITKPECVIVRLDASFSKDIGAICYENVSQRFVVRNICSSKSERLVDLKSLIKSRRKVAESLIRYCSDAIDLASKKAATVNSDIRCVLNFVHWADGHGYDFPFFGVGQARIALQGYNEYFRVRVERGEISLNAAALEISRSLRVISDILDTDEIAHGVRFLKMSQLTKKSTEPPPEDLQGRLYAICQSFFNGLTKLVLEREKFPYPLEVPKFLGAKHSVLWLFPTRKWCMPPHELKNRENLNVAYWAYDYENGKIADVGEIYKRYVYVPKRNKEAYMAESAIYAATEQLWFANNNFRNVNRLNNAIFAHNVFIVMFLANTGANWTTIQQLKWDDEYSIDSDRQGFRTIKYRASGKAISFEIQTTFLPLFKKYLALREFILLNTSSDYLFMSCRAKGSTIHTEQLYRTTLRSILNSLQNIDPECPRIMSRQWRAGKSDWLLRNTDVSTAARVLQNTEETVLKSYSEGSHSKHIEEMSDFLNRMQTFVVDDIDDGDIKNALGTCKHYKVPQQKEGAAIIADCQTPEGCLFCENYKVHADEVDTRKLVSCKYCLNITSGKLMNDEQYQRVFKPVIARIDTILEEIDSHANGIVKRIEAEVLEGELDSYWLLKLEMLQELGLAS